jgi:iron transport multicopper oxidase
MFHVFAVETTVWGLEDWYHEVAPDLVLPCVTSSSQDCLVLPRTNRTPDAALLNGLGRYDGGNATQLSVNTVTQGTRYRIRLINMACDPNYVSARRAQRGIPTDNKIDIPN